MKKIFYILIISVSITFGQTKKEHSIDYIYGTWKCVLSNYEGFNKFSLKQYKQIKKAKLHIERNKIYFENIAFLGVCNFKSIQFTNIPIKEIDLYGTGLWRRYDAKNIKELKDIDVIDKPNCYSCYNECTCFILKKDTLINLCGGYTYFYLKVKK